MNNRHVSVRALCVSILLCALCGCSERVKPPDVPPCIHREQKERDVFETGRARVAVICDTLEMNLRITMHTTLTNLDQFDNRDFVKLKAWTLVNVLGFEPHPTGVTYAKVQLNNGKIGFVNVMLLTKVRE